MQIIALCSNIGIDAVADETRTVTTGLLLKVVRRGLAIGAALAWATDTFVARHGRPRLLRVFWGIEIGEKSVIFANFSYPGVDPARIRIGKGVIIERDVSIAQNPVAHYGRLFTEIGAYAIIGQGAYIEEGVRIGERTRVQHRSVVRRSLPPNVEACGDPATETGRRSLPH